uniref:Coiled-coil domain-containing protein 181 n=1 Tax=Glossina morsitans morsitans TaxID=37546 RepID=A0A1B0FNB1_GLOMM
MANIYETERESDDDSEIYFLKPVNEYNIVDKIKEANKELFAHENLAVNDEENNENVTNNMPINRKVSFAANLEEYEPQDGTISSEQLLDKLTEESNESNCVSKLEVIVEESQQEEEPADELIQTMNSVTQPVELAENLIEIFDETTKELKKSSDDLIVDEICEEIIVMDIENDNNSEQIETTPRRKSSSSFEKKILKQITFDCDDNEFDNESLTNLLISDNADVENIDNNDNDDYNCNESVCEEESEGDEFVKPNPQSNNNAGEFLMRNINDDNDEDDDDNDDDQLSIIVASYIPDSYDNCDQTSLTTTERSVQQTRNRRQNKLSFGRHFPFQRTTNTSPIHTSTHKSSKHFKPPPEVTDLKLHYKVCCEYKHTQQRLPKYTGYLSEYGLSREQLIERERKLQHKHRSLLQQTLKTTEAEVRKMHDNERAFVKWLKNKMRFPINRTRNMFDVKRSFGAIKKINNVNGGDETDANGPLISQHKVIKKRHSHSASSSKINEN